jgi:hypothetical protein
VAKQDLSTSTAHLDRSSPSERRRAYLRRHKKLVEKREPMMSLWRDLAKYVNPERFKFADTDKDSGDNFYSDIYNNRPLLSAETEAAGMMTHHTSPSRPWFRVALTSPRQTEPSAASRAWLAAVERVYSALLALSNIYNKFFEYLQDLVTPGSAVLFVEEDREDGIRGWVFTCGTYCLAAGANGRVDTLSRELKLTVKQLVERFGYDACSPKVREMFDRGELDQERKILHVVEPRTVRDPDKLDSRNMPWASVWLEMEGGDVEGFLRESGYRTCPFMATRWAVFADDVYGRSPAMRALGDSKELQKLELDKARIYERIANPSWKGPTELDGRSIDVTPGGFTSLTNSREFEPSYVPEAKALTELRQDIALCERRIEQAFSVDLFRMLIDDDRRQITAEEIRAKSQERMLQLGPVLERAGDEWLDPFFDRVFDIVNELRLLPEPPEELQGEDLRVEYISVMASAQKMLGTTGVERLVSFTLGMSEALPEALAKLSPRRIVDSYAAMLGTDPQLLKTDEEVEQEVQAQRAAAEQQMMAEQATMATQGVKNLANAPISDQNALGQMLGAIGPVAAAAGGVEGV